MRNGRAGIIVDGVVKKAGASSRTLSQFFASAIRGNRMPDQKNDDAQEERSTKRKDMVVAVAAGVAAGAVGGIVGLGILPLAAVGAGVGIGAIGARRLLKWLAS